MAASEGKIVVKLVLDTSEFVAQIERIKESFSDGGIHGNDWASKQARKEIAEQVRRHCTPSSDAYTKGGDTLIAAVADWIENPPEWVPPVRGIL
jgi:hypothetical protein